MIAVALIAAERRRQITLFGFTAKHDDDHSDGSLADAAIAYASDGSLAGMPSRDELWPWDDDPPNGGNDRIQELVKAGALIAAEIDRRLRCGETTIANAPDELFVNADSTFLVRRWPSGRVEVSYRANPDEIWGAPIPLEAER